MSVSQNLKDKREEAGKTQEQLAEATGLSRSMIAKAETNLKWNPTIRTLNELSDKLECPVEDLVKRKTG